MLSEQDLQTDTERELWSAIAQGAAVDAMGRADDQREVRAQLIEELLTTERRPGDGRARALRLRGARITGTLDLRELTVVCGVTIVESDFDEPLLLAAAQLPRLHLTGCRFPTLNARQIETRGDVLLDQIEAHVVNVSGARVGGGLSLAGATLDGDADHDITLVADRIDVRGSVALDDLTTTGEASISNASIGAQLLLDGATCTNEAGDALVLDGTKIGADLFANHLTATGTVRLIGATVAGELHLRDAVLVREDGVALHGDSLVVGLMHCTRLRTTGELRLQDARVGSGVLFDGAVLSNPDGQAIAADNLRVGTNLFCRNGFTMAGSMGLNRAEIGVSLSLRDASMKRSDGEPVLDASGIEVGQHLFLGPNLVVEGDIDLRMARIAGALGLGGATLADSVAIRLPDVRAGQWADFQWPRMPASRPWYKRWRRRGTPATERPYAPHINGFVYESFGPETDDVATRLDWIAHAEQAYVPQAYDQLASVYRAAGREEDARDVMVAKQRRKRRQLRLPGRMWNRFLDVTVGYGYHTGRAVFGLLAVMLVGWPVFALASWEHLRPLKDANQLPQFEPWLYSMDAVLPVITFGQESAWAPTGFALYWYAFSVLAGWILGTALIAALTAMLNRS